MKSLKEFYGLSKEFNDNSIESVKKLMTNLLFIWCVTHGGTFSYLSVLNNFYFSPPNMRKPLSALPNTPLTNAEKQNWISPCTSVKDYMNLIKAISNRRTSQSVTSGWNEYLIDPIVWKAINVQEAERKGQK